MKKIITLILSLSFIVVLCSCKDNAGITGKTYTDILVVHRGLGTYIQGDTHLSVGDKIVYKHGAVQSERKESKIKEIKVRESSSGLLYISFLLENNITLESVVDKTNVILENRYRED